MCYIRYDPKCFATSSIKRWRASRVAGLDQSQAVEVMFALLSWGPRRPFSFCLCSLRPSARLSWDDALRPSWLEEAQDERSNRKTVLVAPRRSSEEPQPPHSHCTARWERVTSCFTSLGSGWYAMQLLVTNWDGGCAKLTFPSVLQATVHQIFTTNLPEVISEKTAGKAPLPSVMKPNQRNSGENMHH